MKLAPGLYVTHVETCAACRGYGCARCSVSGVVVRQASLTEALLTCPEYLALRQDVTNLQHALRIYQGTSEAAIADLTDAVAGLRE